MIRAMILAAATATAASLLTFSADAEAQSGRYMPSTLAPVVEEALPAVVNISSVRVVQATRRQRSPFSSDPFFRYFFGDRLERRIPQERREQSLGSGVIISPDGFVVTNSHVLQDGDAEVRVYWEDKSYEARVVGRDTKTDVAILKIDPPEDLPYLPFGNSDDLRVGDFVLAIGNPFGLDRTVTMGIVSAKGRADVGIIDYEDFIQTDAAINPGNSGGALLNLDGELIGVNTAILSRSGGYQGIGFAIPSLMAERVANSIREHGEVRRGWIGVTLQGLTADLANAMGLNRQVGVLVSDVYADGPAARSGMRQGDIILKVDDRDVHTLDDFRRRTGRLLPGMTADITYLRADDIKTVTLDIERQPEELTEAFEPYVDFEDSPLPGLSIEELTPESARRYGYPARSKGILISDVAPGSAAAEAGMRPGDVITKVERIRVHTVEALEQIMSRVTKDKLLLIVNRGRRAYFFALPIR
jgi:serine protease Do